MRYRPAPLELCIRARRYRRVTDALPTRYRPTPLFVGRYRRVTDTPRLWFIKLKEERGGAPEAFGRRRLFQTHVAFA